MLFAFERFLSAAKQHAERNAMVIAGKATSYQQLLHQVQAIQLHLKDEAPQQLVGVWTQPEVATYASLLACWSVGSGYVPLNHKFPTARNLHILQQTGVRLILASRPSATLDALLSIAGSDIKVIYTNSLATVNFYPTPTPISSSTIAYLLFTSGSTGKPKGVPITHGNLASFLSSVTNPTVYPLSAEDKFLQMFELTFDLSIYSYLVPLVVGASFYPVPEEGVGFLQIAQLLQEEQLTVALMVPSVIAYLMPYLRELQLPALRLNLFCGEALPVSWAKQWASAASAARIENVYGPTETTIFCTRYVWEDTDVNTESAGLVPIGKPLHDVQLLLLDGEDKVTTTEGELCIAGEQLTTGYWHNAERNAVTFLNLPQGRFYRTGDNCRMLPSSDYLYVGRADEQVKIDGYRVELGEVEDAARRLAGITLAAAVAVTTVQGTLAIHLFVENHPDIKALQACLQDALPHYLQPRRVHTLPKLPLNINGKLDRGALKKLVQEGTVN